MNRKDYSVAKFVVEAKNRFKNCEDVSEALEIIANFAKDGWDITKVRQHLDAIIIMLYEGDIKCTSCAKKKHEPGERILKPKPEKK